MPDSEPFRVKVSYLRWYVWLAALCDFLVFASVAIFAELACPNGVCQSVASTTRELAGVVAIGALAIGLLLGVYASRMASPREEALLSVSASGTSLRIKDAVSQKELVLPVTKFRKQERAKGSLLRVESGRRVSAFISFDTPSDLAHALNLLASAKTG